MEGGGGGGGGGGPGWGGGLLMNLNILIIAIRFLENFPVIVTICCRFARNAV